MNNDQLLSRANVDYISWYIIVFVIRTSKYISWSKPINQSSAQFLVMIGMHKEKSCKIGNSTPIDLQKMPASNSAFHKNYSYIRAMNDILFIYRVNI